MIPVRTATKGILWLLLILGIAGAAQAQAPGRDFLPDDHAPGDPLPWGLPVAEIRLEGLNRTRENVVTRELLTRVGEPCLLENLEQEVRDLEQLDIFADLSVTAATAGDQVVLTYRFEELFKFLPTVGIKFSDETGVSAGGGVKIPNLGGRGVYLSARVMFGGATELEVLLKNRNLGGNHFGYDLEYYHRDKENQIAGFLENADELYLRFGPRLGQHGRVGGRVEFVSMRSDRDGVTLNPNNHDKNSRLGLFLGYDSLDAFVGTTTGWWSEIMLTQAIKLFPNSSGYTQGDLDLRRYVALAEDHTLALFSLTTLRSGTVGSDIAPWERFGIGGTNTVRGWTFAAQTGKNQMINTAEYRFTLLKPRPWDLPFNFRYRGGLQLAAFVDYGLGWDDGPEFAADNFITGYGVGARLLIPIVGMARIDFGWGESGQGVFLHLGSFEKATAARKRVR